ncbi:MAG: glutamine amidotransferase [Hassallia sp. WJT32-NPBG1]|jgi:GMP synthase (glutamine-hydrolysing)|nr:glutamine amidotransferase [Hassallia sp. WJT32-NPBG1]
MQNALVIQHVPFEDLGNLRPVLEQRGYQIVYQQAGLDDLSLIEPLQPDLLIILGGPIGVYEEQDYPFIKDELRLLEKRLTKDLPTLGICLGSQLMARALGALVYPGGNGKEVGWGKLQLSPAGESSFLRYLSASETAVLHWHGDTFDLPKDAVLLASSPQYQNQAFSWGNNCLGLQFHPEVTARGMERWFIGHACEIASLNGTSVSQLRADTRLHAPALESMTYRFWDDWLDGLGVAETVMN